EWMHPEKTMAEKSVAKLYDEVKRVWNTIRFVNGDGKPIAYTATLETEQGTIVISLRPDWAPNHVRSFVALAKVGYYDGLGFESAIEVPDEQGKKQEAKIQGGSPRGSDEDGDDSIGYWLKPELRYQIQDQSLADLREAGVPEAVMTKLSSLKD